MRIKEQTKNNILSFLLGGTIILMALLNEPYFFSTPSVIMYFIGIMIMIIGVRFDD